MSAVSLTQAGTDVSPKLAQLVEFLSCVQEAQEKLCPLLSCTKIIRNVASQTTPKTANEPRAIRVGGSDGSWNFERRKKSKVQSRVSAACFTYNHRQKTAGKTREREYDWQQNLTNMR